MQVRGSCLWWQPERDGWEEGPKVKIMLITIMRMITMTPRKMIQKMRSMIMLRTTMQGMIILGTIIMGMMMIKITEMFQMMSPRYSATAISWPDRGMVGHHFSYICDTSQSVIYVFSFASTELSELVQNLTFNQLFSIKTIPNPI